MKDNLINIIYPTVRTKFDELTLKYNKNTDTFLFRDDDNGNYPVGYNRRRGFVIVRLDYFMLHYFGNSKENMELFKEIFIDLLNDYFKSVGESFVLNDNVTFKYFY